MALTLRVFTSAKANNKQPTLLLAAVVMRWNVWCWSGILYRTVWNTAQLQTTLKNENWAANSRFGISSITGTTGWPLTTTWNPGVIRTTRGGHGTYLFPYEGTMDNQDYPVPVLKSSILFGMETNARQELPFASISNNLRSTSIEIVNRSHIETEVPQDERGINLYLGTATYSFLA